MTSSLPNSHKDPARQWMKKLQAQLISRLIGLKSNSMVLAALRRLPRLALKSLMAAVISARALIPAVAPQLELE